MELQGKVAFITGAGSGIGKATALRFAREGARVAVLSDTEAEIDRTAREIRATGGEALSCTGDVALASDMESATKAVIDRWGRLDIVFAHAGINGVWAPLDELDPAEWDLTMNTNLRGAFLTLHYAVPHLKRAGGGSVVVTSSINGTRVFSTAGASAYATSKAGLMAFTEMAALELAPHHIRVNVICPFGNSEGTIEWQKHEPESFNTTIEKVPLQRVGDVRTDIGALIAFLIGDDSTYITAQTIFVDGGLGTLR